MNQNPLNKKSHPEPVGGWTKDDRALRCITETCGHGKDESGEWIGTLLSRITVSVSYPDAPYTTIALAGICRRCHRLYSVKLLPAARELEISQDNIEACLRATKNNSSFKLTELYAGKIEEMEFSPALKEIFARHKRLAAEQAHKDRTEFYNPNAFTEPQEQEVLPF